MHLADGHPERITSTLPPNEVDTSLRGWRLLIARTVWIVLVVVALALLLASIPPYLAYLHLYIPCTTFFCTTGIPISATDVQELQAVHLSIDMYAVLHLIADIFPTFCFIAVGVLLFWRKSHERVALFASAALVLFPMYFRDSMLTTLPPVWSPLIQSFAILGVIGISFLFYVFPDGRFLPHWTRWLALTWSVYWSIELFLPFVWKASWLNSVLYASFVISLIVVQLYRYHRLSTPEQRQQIKWVIFGVTVGVGGYLITAIVRISLLPLFFHPGLLSYLISYALVGLFVLLFPISIGVAILHSHLWDIDILINRTLVYSTLTGSLILIYVSVVMVLQLLLHGIIGQTSPLAIIGSTLTISALFQPLRRWFQSSIDRRFYRQKYDASLMIARFSETLRREVDLEQVCEQLVTVVEETMQPAQVSLWLRQPARQEKFEQRIPLKQLSSQEDASRSTSELGD